MDGKCGNVENSNLGNKAPLLHTHDDRYPLINREFIDYAWANGKCDAHVYRSGGGLQLYIHIDYAQSGLGNFPAYTERELYSVNADKWKPWVDINKVTALCDNSTYSNCYFTLKSDGKIMFGTRDVAIPSSANTHFYCSLFGISR